ncbi:hypothetical protein H5410_055796 [Solanum commersonii]|uniref:Uncharacterized protein n=1 Tax=Solanum commersonii TaxID=4109 RepID=A0A9J5WLA3_SOLCO|nr:hypothetical protein H5410_055796 [Solanum commersonii]
MERKSKYQMTLVTVILGGNFASMFCDELSQPSFNFGESKSSTYFSISTKFNSFMVDAIDMDEKFAMMEQTIETLKKSIDDKNLQIAQLMSKLDLSNSGESRHNLTMQEKFYVPTTPVDSQCIKQSASVTTLTVQQLQDMITNTIKAQYRGLPHKALPLVASQKIEYSAILLQFGSFKPVKFFALKKTTNTTKVYDFSNEKNADTWILVARKKQKRQRTSKL